MKMLTDNPTIKDRFGFQSYADLLANAVIDTQELPFCIGIFGAWGTGKSSLMLMIENKVKEHYKTIWFNPWKYDKKEELWHALIQTILYRISENGDQQVKEKALNLAKAFGWNFIKDKITTLTSGIIDSNAINVIKEIILKENELYYKHVNQFEHDFKEVIDLYTGSKKKLVIFIDDLDRCLPENAITVLESLKLFIGEASCVFVLGMDQYVVEQGIKFRFGEKINMSGRDYLDKIIQVPFYLPPVPFVKLQGALTEHFNENNNHIWQLINWGFKGNPRRTKRFINSFYLIRMILEKAPLTELNTGKIGASPGNSVILDNATQDFYLAQILIFQMVFTDLYEHFKLNPGDWKEIYENLVAPQAPNIRDQLLQNRKDLEKFWNNPDLRSFLNKTAKTLKNDFPDPPSNEIVVSLLNAVSLVSGEQKSSTFSNNKRFSDMIEESNKK